jgi:diaminohydroxyphosphoribosylaminopyrimidine deaminase/5-amino-6-(5-phosphoribosylamino)uracil reductase
MNFDELMMFRCLEQAALGRGMVAPNPMVGCVITYHDKIISESYHKAYGSLHAEPNAINQITDQSIFKDCTLYVNLEPCAHHGKTPPCANLIAEHQFKRVVIGCTDSFTEVNGRGIEILRNAGIDLSIGVLEKKCRDLNKRFFTSVEKERPYIILKWAQSKDGFIGQAAKPNLKISNDLSRQLTHLWRSQEQAIIVGTNTALIDNPSLTTRMVKGKNPTRFVIDLNNKIPNESQLLTDDEPCFLFTSKPRVDSLKPQKMAIEIDVSLDITKGIVAQLHQHKIQSIIIEGGAITLQHFIDAGLWDEARVFYSSVEIESGIVAPLLKENVVSSEMNIDDAHSNDTLVVYQNSQELFR